MLNEVVLEGIIVRTWTYADDLLFRLACYRDPDLPQKPHKEIKDPADFITIRVTQSSPDALSEIKKGQQVRVHGFLQSRDYQESLADFLKDARGAEPVMPEDLNPLTLCAPRTTSEVIARRIIRQSNGRR